LARQDHSHDRHCAKQEGEI
jgi:hypothetical protein